MKSCILICLLLAVAVSKNYAQVENSMIIQAEPPIPLSQCPAYNYPNQIVFFPYPNDDTKYYECINGLAYTYECLDGFYFSKQTLRCEIKHNSNCDSDVLPGTKQLTVQFSPYPGDCTLYYETRLLRCPINYRWNVIQERCELSQIEGCTAVAPGLPYYNPSLPTGPPPTQTPSMPRPGYIAPLDPNMMCQTSNGKKYLPYIGDCQKFIYCGPTTAAVLYCPPGLSWDAIHQGCMPGNVCSA